jgi:hypothetical protein
LEALLVHLFLVWEAHTLVVFANKIKKKKKKKKKERVSFLSNRFFKKNEDTCSMVDETLFRNFLSCEPSDLL